MEMQNRIFRKAALDKLSSPEQLDQLMQVTTPKSWLALGACCALVLTTLLWSVVGSIPTKVEGRGILIRQGGVFVATSRGEGNVEEILVKAGAPVTNNQLLATVNQPELALRIRQGEVAQRRLEKEGQDLREFQAVEVKGEQEELAQQRVTYEAMIQDYQEQIKSLEESIKNQEALLAGSGVVSKVQLLETKNLFYLAQHDLARARIQLKQINVNELQANERRRQQLQDRIVQIQQGEHQLEYLKELYKLNTQIRSPYDGSVLEIMVKPGQLISANTPILSMQADNRKLEARLFLSPAEGKVVETKMEVAISPVSVKKEEYGFMLGRVISVSAFPATQQGMLHILENQALVAEFSQSGPPIEITVILELEPNTTSGFRWSSAKGPPIRISSGTLCQGTITIANQRPITLVLPSIKKSLGM